MQMPAAATLSSIVREEGMSALWTGLAPRVARRTLQQAFTWTCFEQLVLLFGGQDPSRRAAESKPS